MRVIKVKAASESYVNWSSGRIPAKYAAVTDAGEEVVYFRPRGLREGGSKTMSPTITDTSGQMIHLAHESFRFVSLLSDFRTWVADDLEGAYVRFRQGPLN